MCTYFGAYTTGFDTRAMATQTTFQMLANSAKRWHVAHRSSTSRHGRAKEQRSACAASVFNFSVV